MVGCTYIGENVLINNDIRCATIYEITSFFKLQKKLKNGDQLVFFSDTDSTLLRWISVAPEELKKSLIIQEGSFDILVLDNPAESSMSCFIKQKNKSVNSMLEIKHFPDSIFFSRLADTLIVGQFYWKYDFGSNLYNIRKYYFIGEKTGFFKYGYTSYGKDTGLDLSSSVVKNNCILIKENTSDLKIQVFSDTLKRKKTLNNDFLSETNLIYFREVVFM
jgi:hypothetical protein